MHGPQHPFPLLPSPTHAPTHPPIHHTHTHTHTPFPLSSLTHSLTHPIHPSHTNTTPPPKKQVRADSSGILAVLLGLHPGLHARHHRLRLLGCVRLFCFVLFWLRAWLVLLFVLFVRLFTPGTIAHVYSGTCVGWLVGWLVDLSDGLVCLVCFCSFPLLPYSLSCAPRVPCVHWSATVCVCAQSIVVLIPLLLFPPLLVCFSTTMIINTHDTTQLGY
jgi:hypothetical protein